jgi:hypothetical protein
MTSIGGSRKRNSRTARTIAGAAIALSLGMLAITGCSSTTPAPQPNLTRVELTFNLSQCVPIDAHIYKCPSIDKPICDPDYAGPQADECIRIGRKGSVFVMGPGGE